MFMVYFSEQIDVYRWRWVYSLCCYWGQVDREGQGISTHSVCIYQFPIKRSAFCKQASAWDTWEQIVFIVSSDPPIKDLFADYGM